MPTRCTAPARYSGIRNSWPAPTHAGRPDSPGRMFAPPRARLLTPLRSPKSPKLECALEPPSGLSAPIGLQFGVGAEIGIGVAPGVPPGGRRLALLVARETAVAAPGAEIAALDAEWIISRRGGQRADDGSGTAQHQRLEYPWHRMLPPCLDRNLRSQADSSRRFTSIHVPAFCGYAISRRDRPNGLAGRDSRADRDCRRCNRGSRCSRETAPTRWPGTAHSS